MALPLSINVPIEGGNAEGEFNSSASGSLPINYNPIFDVGSGAITASPTDTATEEPTASTTGGTLLTALPSQETTAAATSASSPLQLSSTTLLIIGGVLLLVLVMPAGKR
jgi:hypothetical protein